MKKTKKILYFAVCIVMALGMFALTGCGGDQEAEEPAAPEAPLTFAEADVPEEISAIVEEVKGCASKYADQLGAEFGDAYAELIESGEADSYSGFADMKEQLDQVRKECGATYVYLLSPADGEGNPSLDGDVTKDGSFLITVDGSEEPDDWGVDYGWEIQFEEAWNGEAAAARSAWEDNEEGTELCWSAFAPIVDSQGEVVCILGIDYPANQVADFPEWDRDSDKWNGIEE